MIQHYEVDIEDIPDKKNSASEPYRLLEEFVASGDTAWGIGPFENRRNRDEVYRRVYRCAWNHKDKFGTVVVSARSDGAVYLIRRDK